MSKRRKPGEIVKREAGSGFVGSSEPDLIRIPYGEAYFDEDDPCILGCGDPDCREWANLQIVTGPYAGNFIYHISECEMDDVKEKIYVRGSYQIAEDTPEAKGKRSRASECLKEFGEATWQKILNDINDYGASILPVINW